MAALQNVFTLDAFGIPASSAVDDMRGRGQDDLKMEMGNPSLSPYPDTEVH